MLKLQFPGQVRVNPGGHTPGQARTIRAVERSALLGAAETFADVYLVTEAMLALPIVRRVT